MEMCQLSLIGFPDFAKYLTSMINGMKLVFFSLLYENEKEENEIDEKEEEEKDIDFKDIIIWIIFVPTDI